MVVVSLVLILLTTSFFVLASNTQQGGGTTAGRSSEQFSQGNCDSYGTCQEIDDVWKLIASIIDFTGSSKNDPIWVPNPNNPSEGEWASYLTVYPDLPENEEFVPAVYVSSNTYSGGNMGNFDIMNNCIADSGQGDYVDSFLDTVAWAEGGANKYNVMVGGELFNSYTSHPVYTDEMNPSGVYIDRLDVYSTAAGRYQFIKKTFDSMKKKGYFQGSEAFSSQNQDKAAWYLASEKAGRGLTVEDLESAYQTNDFTTAATKVAKEWASFPYFLSDCSEEHCGNDCYNEKSGEQCGNGYGYYGQGEKNVNDLLEVFKRCYNYRNPEEFYGFSDSFIYDDFKRILVLGDSLTYQGTHTYGFVTLLNEKMNNYGFYFEGRGYSGCGSEYIKNCLVNNGDSSCREDCVEDTPMVSSFDLDNYYAVMIMAGVNDGVTDVDETYNNLDEMYVHLKSSDVEVITLPILPWGGYEDTSEPHDETKDWSEEKGENTIALNSKISSNSNIDLFIGDAYSSLEDHENSMYLKEEYTSDKLHLSSEGHKALADAIYGVLSIFLAEQNVEVATSESVDNSEDLESSGTTQGTSQGNDGSVCLGRYC